MYDHVEGSGSKRKIAAGGDAAHQPHPSCLALCSATESKQADGRRQRSGDLRHPAELSQPSSNILIVHEPRELAIGDVPYLAKLRACDGLAKSFPGNGAGPSAETLDLRVRDFAAPCLMRLSIPFPSPSELPSKGSSLCEVGEPRRPSPPHWFPHTPSSDCLLSTLRVVVGMSCAR
jgi:hypothetical protein